MAHARRLYPKARSTGKSILLLDFPGLTGDQALRQEVFCGSSVSDMVVVVVSARLIGRDEREALREALRVVRRHKKNVRFAIVAPVCDVAPHA